MTHKLASRSDPYQSIVSKVLREAGYRDSATGIDPERCEIQVRFNRQLGDIN
jgi:S-adenosylmethionine synthetase